LDTRIAHLRPLAGQTRHKDLQDLRKLPRMALFSYLQKQAQPPRPRVKTATSTPSSYPKLAAFLSKRLVKWIYEYLLYRVGPRHPFLTYDKSGADQGLYKLEGGDEIRIALAGDWGTGTDEAERVANLITAFKPHYAIHLGDVYFVGDPKEVDENFLGVKNPENDYEPCLWPSGSNGSFSLNGNHEMYARGMAYFDRMLPALGVIIDGVRHRQKASFFCLENDYWRIIALDTGYNSLGWPIIEYFHEPACALRPEQIDWLRTVVRPRENDPRGIILLTHHQYYSRYDYWYPTQARQLAAFLSRPVLWFWGHEHRMAIYQEFGVTGGIRAFGRCIGHGGMPIDLPPKRPKHAECIVEFTDKRHYPNDEHLKVGYNGYAQLTLRNQQLTVDYVDVEATVIFTETWRVDNGVLRRLS
jgi:Calcineurin-like phosphoesterase